MRGSDIVTEGTTPYVSVDVQKDVMGWGWWLGRGLEGITPSIIHLLHL